MLRALILGVIILLPTTSEAATLYFGSGSGTVGQSVSLSVLVSAENGESLNGISTRIQYPTDKLSLSSISRSGSILTLWAEEPNFSNSSGTASLEGIVPNPGFSGQGGRVVTLTFRVLAPGQATVSFGQASVLANDGRGTNILTSASSRTLTLSAAPTPPPATEKPVVKKPVATEAVVATSTEPEAATTTPELAPIQEAGEVVTTYTRAWTPILIPAFAVLGILALLGLALYGLTVFLHKARLRRLASEDAIDRSFAILRKDLGAHIKRLKQSSTTLGKKEVAFLTQFEKDLTDVETIVDTVRDKDSADE